MIKTELEQLITQALLGIKDPEGSTERQDAITTYEFKNDINETISAETAWLHANNTSIKNFLTQRTFWYDTIIKNLRMYYHVTLFFHQLTEHTTDCPITPEKMCDHTAKYFRDFLHKTEEEQQEIIDLLITKGFYHDQFFIMDPTTHQQDSEHTLLFYFTSQPTLSHAQTSTRYTYLHASTTPMYLTHIFTEQLAHYPCKTTCKHIYTLNKLCSGTTRGQLLKNPHVLTTLTAILRQKSGPKI